MHMHHVVNNKYIIRIKAHIVRLVLNPQKDLKNLTWLQLICSVVKKATLKETKGKKLHSLNQAQNMSQEPVQVRVVILTNFNLQCSGTPLFLLAKFIGV